MYPAPLDRNMENIFYTETFLKIELEHNIKKENSAKIYENLPFRLFMLLKNSGGVV